MIYYTQDNEVDPCLLVVWGFLIKPVPKSLGYNKCHSDRGQWSGVLQPSSVYKYAVSKARQLAVCALGANSCCLAWETCGNALTCLPSGRWAPEETRSLVLCCQDTAASGRVVWWWWQPQRAGAVGHLKKSTTDVRMSMPASNCHLCVQVCSK